MSIRRFTTYLAFAAALVLVPAAAHAQTYVVGCSGTPVTDGNTLRSTYNTAKAAATAAAPAVVIATACVYDLGGTTISLGSYADLVGYDRNSSIIIAQIDYNTTANTGAITIGSGVDAELANLTIRNDEEAVYGVYNASSLAVLDSVIIEAIGETDGTALYTTGRARVNDAVLRTSLDGEEVPSARAVGLEDVGGDSVVTDTLVVIAGLTCTEAYGAIYDGSDATLNDVAFFVSCSVDATGIDVSGGSAPRIYDVELDVEADSDDGIGVEVSGSGNVVRLFDTVIGVDAGDVAYGVHNGSSTSTLLLTNTTVEADGATEVAGQADAGLLRIDRSSLSATAAYVVASTATGRFGASKLEGTRTNSGPTACVASYDGSYNAIPSTC